MSDESLPPDPLPPDYVYSRGHHYRHTNTYVDFAGRTYVICEHVHDGVADVQAVPLDLYRACEVSSVGFWQSALESCTKRARLAEGLGDARRLGFKVEVQRADDVTDAWVTAVADGLIHTTDGLFLRRDGHSPTGMLAYITPASLGALEAELEGASEHRFVPRVRAGLDFTDLHIALEKLARGGTTPGDPA